MAVLVGYNRSSRAKNSQRPDGVLFLETLVILHVIEKVMLIVVMCL